MKVLVHILPVFALAAWLGAAGLALWALWAIGWLAGAVGAAVGAVLAGITDMELAGVAWSAVLGALVGEGWLRLIELLL